jgi:hypothetical protein
MAQLHSSGHGSKYCVIYASLLFTTSMLVAQQHSKGIDASQTDSGNFLSNQAEAIKIIETNREFRQKSPPSSSITSDYVLLTANESHTLAMEWGETVEVNAVLCDQGAVGAVKTTLLDVIEHQDFQPLGPWDKLGFLRAQRESFGTIFTTPAQYEWVKLLLKLDGRPSDITEYITLLYEVSAGPRTSDKKSGWSDRTHDPQVDNFIGKLKIRLHDRALEVLTEHCSRITSGPSTSKENALRTLNSQLTAAQVKSIDATVK